MKKFGIALFVIIFSTGCVNSRLSPTAQQLNGSGQSVDPLASTATYNNSDANYNCPVNPNVGASYIVCPSKANQTGILVMDISGNTNNTICVIAAQAGNGYSIVEDNAGNAVTQCGNATGSNGLAIDLDAYGYTASALNATYVIRESDLAQLQGCLHGTQSCPNYSVGRFR